VNFRKRLKKYCPGLKFGYFNPYVSDAEAQGTQETQDVQEEQGRDE
jgi:hypothetical protein